MIYCPKCQATDEVAHDHPPLFEVGDVIRGGHRLGRVIDRIDGSYIIDWNTKTTVLDQLTAEEHFELDPNQSWGSSRD